MTTILGKAVLASPIGPLVAIASGRGLCVLEFEREGRMDWLWKRLQAHYGRLEVTEDARPVLDATRRWLDSYLANPHAAAVEVPLDLWGTEFERSVWQAISRIPCGELASYGQIAAGLNRPSSARAVGGATGRNPVALVIPCHRVIGTDGSITGYGGGLDRKRWLLTHEGVIGRIR